MQVQPPPPHVSRDVIMQADGALVPTTRRGGLVPTATAVHVVTVATQWTPTFENFRRSLHVAGHTYSVLGWGQRWGGWGWRSHLYLAFLRSRHPDDVVVLIDAYDVLAARPAGGMAETFRAHGKRVLVGCEWYCGGDRNCGRVDGWWNARNGSLRDRPWRRHINARRLLRAADPAC